MTEPSRRARSRRELQAENEELRAQLAALQTNGDEPKLLTMAEMRDMTEAEINARWPEVVKGLIANKAGDDDE